jgi:diguanylate cyclase (GGDEF)-like protein
VLTDISEQKEVEKRRKELEGELRKAATMDRLTGTLNRQYFENLLALQIRRSETDGSPLSLIMFDIDDFKAVNDTYGHLAGDRVLKSICDTVRAHIRQQDYFGRWGGEEFNVLILGGPESAFQVAEKIRGMIEEGDHGIPRGVTVSLGLATFCKGDHVEDLVRRADEKLYLAKRRGKNRVERADVLASPKDEEKAGFSPESPLWSSE